MCRVKERCKANPTTQWHNRACDSRESTFDIWPLTEACVLMTAICKIMEDNTPSEAHDPPLHGILLSPPYLCLYFSNHIHWTPHVTAARLLFFFLLCHLVILDVKTADQQSYFLNSTAVFSDIFQESYCFTYRRALLNTVSLQPL